MASTWLDTHLLDCGILDLLIGVNIVINYIRDMYIVRSIYLIASFKCMASVHCCLPVCLKSLDELSGFVYMLSARCRKELEGNSRKRCKRFLGPRSQNMQQNFECLLYFTLFYFLPL